MEGSVSYSISLHPPPTVWGEGVGGGECVLQHLSPPSPHCVGGGEGGSGGRGVCPSVSLSTLPPLCGGRGGGSGGRGGTGLSWLVVRFDLWT